MRHLLHKYIAQVATPQALSWLESRLEKLDQDFNKRDYYLTFSMVSRFIKERPAQALPPCVVNDMDISGWDIKQIVRLYLLHSIPHDNVDEYTAIVNELFHSADIKEQVSFYKGLSLLPYPEQWLQQAAEGLRSNAASVFEAVALNNPYPQQYFPELLWNQMVLKALFIKSPVLEITGIEARRNPVLAQMCVDYICEQRNAKRPVSPEIWCLLSTYLSDKHKSVIEYGLNSDDIWFAAATVKAVNEAGLTLPDELQQLTETIENQIVIVNPSLNHQQLNTMSWMDFKKHYYQSIEENEP